MTPRRVLLWRHGRTRWNVEHRFQGQADPPLDEVGKQQAAAGARLLAGYGPTAIVSSDLCRAVQTARPLAELLGLSVTLDPRLRERSLGAWEGLTRDEVERLYPEEYGHWLAGREARQDGGESRADLAERVTAALAAAEGGTVVLVTHSATAMALTGRLLGLPVTGWRAVGPLANGRWSEFTRDEHGWRLRAHNVGPLGAPATGMSTVDGSGGIGSIQDATVDVPVDAGPAAAMPTDAGSVDVEPIEAVPVDAGPAR